MAWNRTAPTGAGHGCRSCPVAREQLNDERTSAPSDSSAVRLRRSLDHISEHAADNALRSRRIVTMRDEPTISEPEPNYLAHNTNKARAGQHIGGGPTLLPTDIDRRDSGTGRRRSMPLDPCVAGGNGHPGWRRTDSSDKGPDRTRRSGRLSAGVRVSDRVVIADVGASGDSVATAQLGGHPSR